MVEFLEQNILNTKQLEREEVIEILKASETKGKWKFSEIYESLEEIKSQKALFWKLGEKTLQKLKSLKCQRKKFEHEIRKLLIEKWIKIDKVLILSLIHI